VCRQRQQESRAVTEKLHDAVVKFDMYRNLQRHRAVLPAIARHLVLTGLAIWVSLHDTKDTNKDRLIANVTNAFSLNESMSFRNFRHTCNEVYEVPP